MSGEAQSAVKLDVLVFCTLLPRVHRLLFCCRECTDCYSVAESAQTVIFLFRSNTSVIHRLSSTDITS